MAAANSPRLSLCMIVRDSAGTLPACLRSIRPWVDELIVVDTGSRDDTRQIAHRIGAQVFEFPWCDDFSAARNESIRHARGEWLFWMDSDDTIDEENGVKLQALARGDHAAGVFGYVMQVACPARGETGGDDCTYVDHIKLFRNLPGLVFEFRIHEQLLPSIRRLGGEVSWSDVCVLHSGSDQSDAGRMRKCERDLRILALEIQDRPEHPFALFNFGMTYSDIGDHARAAEYLERSLRVSSPQESQVRKAYALLVHSYDQLGQVTRARDACVQGLRHHPDDPELLFRSGNLAHQAGHLEEARDALCRVIANRCERHFTSIDTGVLGYKARHNLALVYQDLNQLDLAELEWRVAVELKPRFSTGWQHLGRLLVSRGKMMAAEVLLEQMRACAGLDLEAQLFDAELAEARQEFQRARELLRMAVASFPSSFEALDALCQLEFEGGKPEDAVHYLEMLCERAHDAASAHHNLGAAYLRTGNTAAAKQALQRSLELRPDSPATQRLLGIAGRIPSAAANIAIDGGPRPISTESSTRGIENSLATAK